MRRRRVVAGSTAGRFHGAASFAGAQRLSNANGGGALAPVGGFNIQAACWLRFDTLVGGTYYKVFHMGAGAAATDVLGLHMDGSSGKLAGFTSNGSTYSSVQSIVPTAGKWYFASLTCGGATNALDVYDLSGLLFSGSVGNGGVQLITQPLCVGNGPVASPEPLIGAVDSLMWWPKATAITPATLWNGGKALDFAGLPNTTNLAAFFNLDESSLSATWRDAIGQGNDLAATGSVLSVTGAGY